MFEERHPPDEPDIDREIRVERIRRDLDRIANGTMIEGHFGKVAPAMKESLLEHVRAFEFAEFDTTFNRLIQRGIIFPAPAELDAESLSAKLKELVIVLARMHCFVEDTDHLSDRELYSWLWTDALREEIPDVEK